MHAARVVGCFAPPLPGFNLSTGRAGRSSTGCGGFLIGRCPSSVRSAPQCSWRSSATAVVVAGRRWNGQSEWITLVGVPAIGLAGAAVLWRRGWSRRDLSFRWPAVDPPRWFAQGAVVLAVALAAASGIIAKISGEELPAVEVVRLLVGTAFGEEFVHRAVVLGVWASTTVRSRWVVVANMGTFALWHVAGASHRSGFRWWEVAGPGVL
ncbi:MAG: CPBP family intramembrane metalloprotease [Actinobacteria bacterium]|nr:CPBP family intramembrane metalloprotease [Actinomycetota bacterium]